MEKDEERGHVDFTPEILNSDFTEPGAGAPEPSQVPQSGGSVSPEDGERVHAVSGENVPVDSGENVGEGAASADTSEVADTTANEPDYLYGYEPTYQKKSWKRRNGLYNEQRLSYRRNVDSYYATGEGEVVKQDYQRQGARFERKGEHHPQEQGYKNYQRKKLAGTSESCGNAQREGTDLSVWTKSDQRTGRGYHEHRTGNPTQGTRFPNWVSGGSNFRKGGRYPQVRGSSNEGVVNSGLQEQSESKGTSHPPRRENQRPGTSRPSTIFPKKGNNFSQEWRSAKPPQSPGGRSRWVGDKKLFGHTSSLRGSVDGSTAATDDNWRQSMVKEEPSSSSSTTPAEQSQNVQNPTDSKYSKITFGTVTGYGFLDLTECYAFLSKPKHQQ